MHRIPRKQKHQQVFNVMIDKAPKPTQQNTFVENCVEDV